MSFCDELRKIEGENSYSNKKEEIIHREVDVYKRQIVLFVFEILSDVESIKGVGRRNRYRRNVEKQSRKQSRCV